MSKQKNRPSTLRVDKEEIDRAMQIMQILDDQEDLGLCLTRLGNPKDKDEAEKSAVDGYIATLKSNMYRFRQPRIRLVT